MDRLNHVKLVSPELEEIDRFLTEVVEVPRRLAPGFRVASDRGERVLIGDLGVFQG